MLVLRLITISVTVTRWFSLELSVIGATRTHREIFPVGFRKVFCSEVMVTLRGESVSPDCDDTEASSSNSREINYSFPPPEAE